MDIKILMMSAVATLCYATFGIAVDTDGNPVGPDTQMWDVDMKETTVGDLKDIMVPGYNQVSNEAMKSSMPRNFIISPAPTYGYSGSSGIPSGYYYRTTTGSGQVGYAAKVPIPHGTITVSGTEGDPIVTKFGATYLIGQPADAVIGLSGFVENGCYAGASLRYDLSDTLGLAAYFSANMAVASASLNNITLVPPSGSINFNTPDGVEHYVMNFTLVSGTSSSYVYSYVDEYYDSSSGTWDSTTREISLTYASTADTDWGFAAFGGTPLATLENVDTARSKLIERRGRYGELGTGWGYKVYNFTDDRRSWELRVPKMSIISPTAVRHNRFYPYLNASWTDDVPRPDDALSDHYHYIRSNGYTSGSDNSPTNFTESFRRVFITRDKYSTDGCRSVDYRIGLIPRNPYATEFESVYDFGVVLRATNITISASGQPYLWGGIEVENAYGDNAQFGYEGIVKDFSVSWEESLLSPFAFNYSGYIAYMIESYDGITYTNATPIKAYYTAYNFRPVVTFSGYNATVTVNYLMDVNTEMCYFVGNENFKIIPGKFKAETVSHSITFTFRTAPTLETMTCPEHTVITDYNQHMIWDDGLKCTWQLCVTNGVFFTRKVSNADYREKEYLDD